jgi:hypothetical protein
MSDQVSQAQRWWPQWMLALETAIAVSVVALIVAAGLVAPWVEMALRSMLAVLASLVDFDWPRWIHNLADLLQIATPLVAVVAWGSTRRKRR